MSDQPDAAGTARADRTMPWWGVVLAVVAWVGLWSLTPGLLVNGVGSWFSDDLGTQVLIESAVALILLTAIALILRRRTARALAPSPQMWAYLLPAARPSPSRSTTSCRPAPFVRRHRGPVRPVRAVT